MTTTVQLRSRSDSELRCSLCHGAIGARSGWACPTCDARLHTRCAELSMPCPTLGCRERVTATSAPRQRSGLGARLQAFAALLLVLALWIVASWLLASVRAAWLPHPLCCTEELALWPSFVAVGVVMSGSVAIWRLRRDVYG